ncbi:MAG: branched-chain amino acid ABC transporter permease, partial [Pseudomonadota bacterium]
MDVAQIIANGIVLGSLYACVAVGFSLVWGVLNIINMLHGSMIILGGYLTFFAWRDFGVNPVLALPVVAGLLYLLGFAIQYVFINRVVSA